jgi:hypothetical protein
VCVIKKRCEQTETREKMREQKELTSTHIRVGVEIAIDLFKG